MAACCPLAGSSFVVRTKPPLKGDDIVQYALLLYRNPDVYDALSEDERQAVSAEYWAILDDPRIVTGMGLQPVETATTVRAEDGETLVTDGPFANTKEVFAGMYLLEADDLDAALEVARSLPTTRLGGAVEIRPVVEPVP